MVPGLPKMWVTFSALQAFHQDGLSGTHARDLLGQPRRFIAKASGSANSTRKSPHERSIAARGQSQAPRPRTLFADQPTNPQAAKAVANNGGSGTFTGVGPVSGT